jgi:hypothetical protein
VIPPALSVPDFPIACTLTVVVDRVSDDILVAESIARTDEG